MTTGIKAVVVAVIAARTTQLVKAVLNLITCLSVHRPRTRLTKLCAEKDFMGGPCMKTKKCCFCKKPITDYGNNPAPVKESGRCCDKCNRNIVIPARFIALTQRRTK